ncbi:MAG: glycosyltransferase family 4 protein [Candidatus Taylorbacteria bacterium]|nr:glycosyltransferase family 4 protein [Candidatus Taylorbacteria bacterium]
MNLLIVTQKVDKNDQLLGFFIDWISRFAQKFNQITVLCLEKGEFNLPKNVKVLSLGKDRGAGKLKQLFTFYFLLFTLRKDYDAVLVHMNPVWVVLGGLCWRGMRKKIYFWYTHKAVTSKLRLAEKLADVIFTASKESFRLPSKKVIVTGHGIDTELFKPVEVRPLQRPRSDLLPRFNLGEIKILSVGRIAPVKNYGTLIDAAKILKDMGLNFSVTMIGEAPLDRDKYYEKSLKFKVKSLKLEEHFSFIGKISHKELPAYYQSHDIFVHLSKTGSVDKTLLEAMACGMEVLSSNESSKSFLPEELIFDENNASQLAERIRTISRKSASPALRNYVVENHNLDKLISKISSTIQSG